MASSLPPPSPAAAAVAPHLTPVVHTLTTPDLVPILRRSKLESMSELLGAFESSVERVTVRSTNYEPRQLHRFGVKFVERPLPPWFEDKVGGGAAVGARARSGTVGSARGRPHDGQPGSPLLSRTSLSTPAAHQTPQTPQTPFSWPTQTERDELFLDSLSSAVSSNIDTWLAQTGREELDVRGKRPKRRLPEIGEDVEPEVDPDEGWQGRSIEALTPWYAAMRDGVLKRREMVEWDTFAWPVACLLALSTSHPDPMNALAALWELTAKENLFAPASYPPRSGAEEDGRHDWAQPDILRYIALVHDFGAGGGRDGWEDAQRLHDTIRKTYGLHTALIPVFSAAATASAAQPRARGAAALWPGPPSVQPRVTRPPMDLGISTNDDEYTINDSASQDVRSAAVHDAVERGHELSDDDIKALRIFVRELVVQSIIPWIERAVVVGNEQFTASKRSIGGRLFSAGRKYFGSSANSRSGSPVSATGASLGFNATRGYYPYASQESQTRRLADFAFMLTDYKLAATVYESVSKDFRSDKAWRYYASACRMTGLSLLLSHQPGTPLAFNPDQWLEFALQTPLTAAPGIDLDGLQAIMLYYDAYRLLDDWRFASIGLVRSASDDDELCSALLLEQAAISDLHLPRPARRRFAFHMVMAASRYEKTGQKSLSRRCLSQASSVFRLETPIVDAVRYPAKLSGWTGIRSHIHHGLGRQSYNVGRSAEAAEHFLQLLAGFESSIASDNEDDWLDDFALAWEHLGSHAEQIARDRQLSLPVAIFDAEHARVRVPQNDNLPPSEVDAEAWSSLSDEFLAQGFKCEKRPLSLLPTSQSNNVSLGETFYIELRATNPLNSRLVIGDLRLHTDSDSGRVDIDAPDHIELEPRQMRTVLVPVQINAICSFRFTAVTYRFHDLLPSRDSLERKVKVAVSIGRPQTSKVDTSLLVQVRARAPILAVSVSKVPSTILAGEVLWTTVEFTNTGQEPLTSLSGLCTHPSIARFDSSLGGFNATSSTSATASNSLTPNAPHAISLPNGVLQPKQSVECRLMIRGDSLGDHRIRWLFAYRQVNGSDYIGARAMTDLSVSSSIEVRPNVQAASNASCPFRLTVQISNPAVPYPVIVTGVSSLSPQWQCETPGDVFGTSGLILPWQQSARFSLSVDTVEGASTVEDDNAKFVVSQMSRLLEGKEVSTQQPSAICLHSSSLTIDGSRRLDLSSSPTDLISSVINTHKALRTVSLAAQFPTIAPALHRHLFPLFSPRTLDLLVFWTIPSLNAQGYHHLTGIPVGAGSNALQSVLETAETKAGGLYAESQRERSSLLASLRRSEWGADDRPVRVWLEVDEVVSHNFDQGPCVLPVTFRIRNLSPNKAISYKLVLADVSKQLPPDVVFAGPLVHRGETDPLGLSTVEAQVWICRQGSYDVGGWSLTSSRDGLTWTDQGPRLTIRVMDRNPDQLAKNATQSILVDA